MSLATKIKNKLTLIPRIFSKTVCEIKFRLNWASILLHRGLKLKVCSINMKIIEQQSPFCLMEADLKSLVLYKNRNQVKRIL